MNERLDALCVREDKNGKSWFTKLGSAFPNKDGKGFTLMLDAIPAAVDGQYKIMLRVPLPKDDRGSGGRSQSYNRQSDEREVYNSNTGWADDDSSGW